MTSSAKRNFSELRQLILSKLSEGQKTINQLSSETGINWKTVDNHLVYLVGRGLAKEVFSSRFVRIFEITDKGTSSLVSSDDSKNDDDNRRNKSRSENKSRFEQNGEVRMNR